MDYKRLFKIVFRLISSPADAWEEILSHTDREKNNVFMGFVYPMIGLVGLVVFITSLITYGWGEPLSFQVAMTACCSVAVSLFGGFFLAAKLVHLISTKFLKMHTSLYQTQFFIGYSLVVVFVLSILQNLYIGFDILRYLLLFYTLYIVWEGARVVFKISNNNERLYYTFVASLLVVGCPMLIKFVFDKLTLVLN